MELSPKQIKRIQKLEKFGQDKDLATLENLLDLDEKVDDVKMEINTVKSELSERFSSLQEELKKKLESELVLEIDRDELKGADGYTPIKDVDYFDGKNGKDGVDGKDGKDGKDGLNGKDGLDGKDGYTPVKGKDYFTDEDIEGISLDVQSQIQPFDTVKLSDDIINRAIGIVDNRTSFLINKVSSLSDKMANISESDTLQTVTDRGATTTKPLTAQDFIATTNKEISYHIDGTVNVITTDAGTKTFEYNLDGTLASITGTGVYKNKTLTYTDGVLTAITVN